MKAATINNSFQLCNKVDYFKTFQILVYENFGIFKRRKFSVIFDCKSNKFTFSISFSLSLNTHSLTLTHITTHFVQQTHTYIYLLPSLFHFTHSYTHSHIHTHIYTQHTPSVNFINVLRAFFVQIFQQSQNVTRKQRSYEKFVSKMLMKLTPCANTHQRNFACQVILVRTKPESFCNKEREKLKVLSRKLRKFSNSFLERKTQKNQLWSLFSHVLKKHNLF